MQNLIKQDGPQQEEDKEIVHNTLSAKKMISEWHRKKEKQQKHTFHNALKDPFLVEKGNRSSCGRCHHESLMAGQNAENVIRPPSSLFLRPLAPAVYE